MERIPLAVVGLGDIPVLAARSDVEIVALAIRSNRHAAELIARHHLPAQAATLEQVSMKKSSRASEGNTRRSL